MYHRIVPPQATIQAGMYVSPETFERQLAFLKKKFDILSLHKLARFIDNGVSAARQKPVCALTFDDGWKDFYDFAFPLLQKHGVPATVFLPTAFIGTNRKFWTDHFARLLFCRQTPSKEVTVGPEIAKIVHRLDALPGTFEAQLEAGIALLKNYPLGLIEKVLPALSRVWKVKAAGAERDFLNWAQVHKMLDSGLVAFGSHTVNHQILTTLEDAAVKKELEDSRQVLLEKQVVDDECIAFCYPNGNYNDQIVSMVQAAGYHLAVTTRKGSNRKGDNPLTLRRIGIHQDMSATIALFACRIAGFI